MDALLMGPLINGCVRLSWLHLNSILLVWEDSSWTACGKRHSTAFSQPTSRGVPADAALGNERDGEPDKGRMSPMGQFEHYYVVVQQGRGWAAARLGVIMDGGELCCRFTSIAESFDCSKCPMVEAF